MWCVSRGSVVASRTVARVVLHELEGHVLPRLRAAAEQLGIFALGTARGSDEQEGRALWLERQAGLFTAGRRRELARRHLAALALRRGADPVQTARLLINTSGASPFTAARIACRVHRGGGLGRELVYLPSLLRVRKALERTPRIERVLCRGQVSVTAAPVLARWCN